MVEIRTVAETELETFRAIHNAYVDRNESLATVRDWYQETPELCVGAFEDGTLVGHCLGRPQSATTVELAGIAVKEPYQRHGIGSALISAFENRAAELGYDRVEVGSAGGYVDEFYRHRGYEPEKILVRLAPADPIQPDRSDEYDVIEGRVEDGQQHVYVPVDGMDDPSIEDVRKTFDDPEAIYIMAKTLAPADSDQS